MENAIEGWERITNEVAKTESHTSGIDRCDIIRRWNTYRRLGPDNGVESKFADPWWRLDASQNSPRDVGWPNERRQDGQDHR
jgi:hypothetical protein